MVSVSPLEVQWHYRPTLRHGPQLEPRRADFPQRAPDRSCPNTANYLLKNAEPTFLRDVFLLIAYITMGVKYENIFSNDFYYGGLIYRFFK
jgi:hypothetical protein